MGLTYPVGLGQFLVSNVSPWERKAINAAVITLDRSPEDMKVTLDKVVFRMWRTTKDMSTKYKETSEGGQAITVNNVER